MSESTTYLTVKQAAEHVGAPSTNALRKWVHRHSVPYFLYGKRLRFLRRDLDEAVGNTSRRRNGAFQSHSARFVQEQGSAKGSRLSAKDELSSRHANSIGADDTQAVVNCVDGGAR